MHTWWCCARWVPRRGSCLGRSRAVLDWIIFRLNRFVWSAHGSSGFLALCSFFFFFSVQVTKKKKREKKEWNRHKAPKWRRESVVLAGEIRESDEVSEKKGGDLTEKGEELSAAKQFHDGRQMGFGTTRLWPSCDLVQPVDDFPCPPRNCRITRSRPK